MGQTEVIELKEEIRRGRVKGQVKRMAVIKDECLDKYEIQIDQYGFTIIDSTKNDGFLGSYTSLDAALNKTCQFILADGGETFTIPQYIKEYNNIKNKMLKLV